MKRWSSVTPRVIIGLHHGTAVLRHHPILDLAHQHHHRRPAERHQRAERGADAEDADVASPSRCRTRPSRCRSATGRGRGRRSGRRSSASAGPRRRGGTRSSSDLVRSTCWSRRARMRATRSSASRAISSTLFSSALAIFKPDSSRAALGGDLHEDVDGVAQHDAAPGDDAVHLRELRQRQGHAVHDEVRHGDVHAALLPQPLAVGERRSPSGRRRARTCWDRAACSRYARRASAIPAAARAAVNTRRMSRALSA